MEEFSNKPKYVDEDEMNEAIGRVLWGKNGKKFSMRRLIFAFMKKKLGGKKKK
ncbi:MAG: hypothetical protein KGD65_10335 [Candidatus Lokiarchaeota archaeon]|nr:hypothetical protein [Candidatus Lokiarchaeota archaeon]